MSGVEWFGAVEEKAVADATAEVPGVLTEDMLEQVVERIVRALAPERVILFGSYAEGRASDDSDLDLLVVTARTLSHQERFEHLRGLFLDIPLPVQVITISRQEFEETRGVIGGIAHPATLYGKVVYEKP